MIDPFRISTAGVRGDEIHARMRAEYDRAREGSAPFACFAIEIDRFRRVEGDELRAELQRAAADFARRGPSAADSFGWRGGELLFLCVPGLPPKDANAFAKDLVDDARKLRIAHGERVHRLTLSVGVAHSQRKGALSFEGLLAVAEEGVRVARESGGDHWVHSDLYELFEKRLEHERTEVRQEELIPAEPPLVLQEVWLPRTQPGPAPVRVVAQPVPANSTTSSQAFVEKVRQLVTHLGPGSPRGALLEAELTAMTAEPATASPAVETAEIFERRIAKLVHALELAEQEIARLSRQHGLQVGIPSIYRTVQGLSPDDALAELKRHLMARIFEANLALHEKSLASG